MADSLLWPLKNEKFITFLKFFVLAKFWSFCLFLLSFFNLRFLKPENSSKFKFDVPNGKLVPVKVNKKKLGHGSNYFEYFIVDFYGF